MVILHRVLDAIWKEKCIPNDCLESIQMEEQRKYPWMWQLQRDLKEY
jgi:hypothetical protein